jgi:hypothetical protein
VPQPNSTGALLTKDCSELGFEISSSASLSIPGELMEIKKQKTQVTWCLKVAGDLY